MKPLSSDLGSKRNWGLLLTVPVCIVLAVYFIGTTLAHSDKPLPAQSLQKAWFTPQTARDEELAQKVMVGSCYLCHAYWVGIPNPDVVRPRFAHHVINLDHGTNDRCYNCHLIQDRNKYVANDGSGIVHTQPEKLCARCHGLIFNDWQSGTHGVRRGKWLEPGVFELKNFTCTQCHDPHAPKFKYKQYAAPPVWPEKFIRHSEDGQLSTETSES